MEELAYSNESIRVTPYARAEPGQEPGSNQHLHPYLERCGVRRSQPRRSGSRRANHQIDLDTLRREHINSVPGGLRSTENRNARSSQEQFLRVRFQVLTMEERLSKAVE